MAGISSILFHFAWDVWVKRNEDRYGWDKTDRERLSIERALLQIDELYKIRLDVLTKDRKLFYDSAEQHKQIETMRRGLQQWIHTWSDVIHHSATKAKKYGITNMNSIIDYFHRTVGKN